MKNMGKRILSFALTLALLLGLAPAVALPARAAAQQIGDSTTYWELSGDTLTISGTGATPDYTTLSATMREDSYQNVPWYSSKNSIKKVVVAEGVTGIGNCLFYSSPYTADYRYSFTSVSLPSTLTRIGDSVFYYDTTLTSLTLPTNSPLAYIGNYAFYNCTALSGTCSLPNLTYLGKNAFQNCTGGISLSFGDKIQCILGGNSAAVPDSAYTEDTSLTVTVAGYRSGIGTYSGQMMKATVMKDGQDVTDQYLCAWSTGIGTDDLPSKRSSVSYGFETPDTSVHGEVEGAYGYRYGAVSKNQTGIACWVYKVDGNGKLLCVKKSATIALTKSNNGNAELGNSLSGLSVLMFPGETVQIGALLGRAGLTHVDCGAVRYPSLAVDAGSTEIVSANTWNNKTLTALKPGTGTVNISVYSIGCTFHGTQYGTESNPSDSSQAHSATVTVNVVGTQAKTTLDSISLKLSSFTPGDTVSITLNGETKTGTVGADGTVTIDTFTGLTAETDYDAFISVTASNGDFKGQGSVTATTMNSVEAPTIISIEPSTMMGWTYGDTVDADSRTLTVSATLNEPGTLSYQWYAADSADGAGTAISGATGTSYTIPDGTTTGARTKYYYCVVTNTTEDGEADAASARVPVTVNRAGQAAPDLTAADETVKGKKDGSITGLTTGMEYATTEGGSYTAITDALLSGDTFKTPGTFYVRYPADANHNASAVTAVTIAEGSSITVTFDTGDGSSIVDSTGNSYGDTLTKPSDPTKEGYAFDGWYADAGCTKSWDFEKDTLSADTTLYAKWLAATTPTYAVGIKVASGSEDGSAVADAAVTLRKGDTVYKTLVHSSDGVYSVEGVPDGEYSVVVTTSDGKKTVTALVSVQGANPEQTVVVIPTANLSSKVEVGENTPDVVVGGLNVVASDETVTGTVNTGDSVEVKLTVESKEDLTTAPADTLTEEQKAEQIAQKALQDDAKAATGASTQIEFLDMGILQSTTSSGTTTTNSIHDTGSTVLEIVVPYETSGKYNIGVYRHHVDDLNNVTLKAFGKVSSRAGAQTDGAFYQGDGFLVIYATKFSTYAISYTTAPSRGPAYAGGGASETYPVTVGQPAHGTVIPSVTEAATGDTVTLSLTPDEGYQAGRVTVTDAAGNAIPVTRNADGSMSFTMPAGAAAVKAVFIRAVADPADTGVADWLITDSHIAYLTGYPNGNIGPSDNITRAEVAAIFYRLLKEKELPIAKAFPDIPEGKWYTAAVNSLAGLGILSGYPDGSYGPGRPISRAEFVAIAARFAKIAEGENVFTDVPAGSWAEKSIATATAYGWINGKSQRLFAPTDPITRAEAAVVVNHMLGRAADESYLAANPEKIKYFPDLQDTGKWYYLAMVEACNGHDFTIENGVETWK